MESAKKERTQPKTQKVFRLYNGEWDEVEGNDSPDVSAYKLTYDREFTRDGELVFEIEFDPAGEEVQKQVNTYNEQGRILRHELYNEGVLAETIDFTYDDQGRVATEYREFEEGYPLKTIYSYDDQNRVVEKRIEDTDEELERRETFEYHPEWKDKVTRKVIFDEEDEMTQEEVMDYEERNGEVKTKSILSIDHSMEITRKTVFFDAKSREDNIAYVVYNEKDKALELFRIVHDEQGREIEERSESVNPSENYEVYYTYDESDRVIHQEHRQGDRILSKHDRRFNDHDLPSFHAFRSHSRGMYVDYFEYTYFA
jgi:hypothetical protein